MSIDPENTQLVDELKTIIAKSQQLSRIAASEEFLFNALNDLSESTLKKMINRYGSSSTIVNQLRKRIVEQLLDMKKGIFASKVPVSAETVDKLKLRAGPDNQKAFIQYKKPFSLFYPFFLSEAPEINVARALSELASEIKKQLVLSSVKVKVVDFNGTNNYGSDWVWLAIYNDSHPNQRTAKQFFIAIDQKGIFCSFYDRPRNHHIQQQFYLTNELSIFEITNFFEKHVESLNLDTYSPEIAAFSGRIYKLSHGINEISDTQHAQLLQSQKAIIHEDTPPMGKRKVRQGDEFMSVNAGDLFYLCRSNQKIELIGQFLSTESEYCEIEELGKEGWVERSYRIIAVAKENSGYYGKLMRWWMPNFHSTFFAIPQEDLTEADAELFQPFFQLNSQEIFLKATAQTTNTKSESPTQHGNFSTRDTKVEPILGLKKMVVPIANLLRIMQHEPGQMFGIFGEWGRGKTFFVKHLCDEFGIDYETEQLDSENVTSSFYFAKFHAWKYQDSEATWAYLYETLVKAYYKHLNKKSWSQSTGLFKLYHTFRKWLNEVYLLIRLNLVRNGYTDFIYLGILLVAVFSFTYFFGITKDGPRSFETVWKQLLSGSGLVAIIIPAIPLLRFVYKSYQIGNKGKQIVQRYTSKKSFSSAMGLQAEVQEELIHLLKAWLPPKKKKKKNTKLMLFVDDLDRCDKEKIISIADSLRVVLEDPEIAKRLIVIMAVDEEKLKAAIASKYDLKLPDPTNDKANEGVDVESRDQLIINYIDKLFIYAIKLHDLQESEKEKILFNYTNNEDFIRKSRESTIESSTAPPEEKLIVEEPTERDISDVIDSALDDGNIVTEEEKAVIYTEELERILEHLENKDVTPRKIRIIFYRLLLAKYIASEHNISVTNSIEDFLAEWITRKSMNPKEEIIFPQGATFAEYEHDLKKIINTIVAY